MNYLVLAMKRSGHHAVMNWIKSHTGQNIYNNVCFGWQEKLLLTMRGLKKAENGIANIEDFNAANWEKYDFPDFEFVKNARVIIVIRSPKNWLASCFKRKDAKNVEHRDVYEYLDKPYINDSRFSSCSRIDLYCRLVQLACMIDCVAVTFDRFIRDAEYRRSIARLLDIKFDKKKDDSLLTVSKEGGGSSFDGRNFDGAAHAMNVNERNKYFVNDDRYKSMLIKVEAGVSESLYNLWSSYV